MLAISIAHLSLIRLRFTDPDRERPYSVPFGIKFRGDRRAAARRRSACCSPASGSSRSSPCTAAPSTSAAAGCSSASSPTSSTAALVEGISLTDRVTVPEQALQKQAPDVELESVLVPVFGEGLDDEIVSHRRAARRLRSAPRREPPAARAPLRDQAAADGPARRAAAAASASPRREQALARAMEIAEEYPSVEVDGELGARRAASARRSSSRRASAASRRSSSAASRRRRIRGGAVLGGVRGAKPAEVGPITEYVLRHAPCRVLLTAPPEPESEPLPSCRRRRLAAAGNKIAACRS